MWVRSVRRPLLTCSFGKKACFERVRFVRAPLPPQKAPILPTPVRAPGLEALLLQIKLIGKVDVRPAIQQVTQIQSRPLQVHCVDLEVPPIQSAVRIVVIDLALALRILRPLNCQRHSAGRPELRACILLVSVQRMPLVELSFYCIGRLSSSLCHHRPLKSHSNRRLQTERILRMDLQHHVNGRSSQQDRNNAESKAQSACRATCRPRPLYDD